MNALPFSPLTTRELLDRHHSLCVQACGALEAWDESPGVREKPERALRLVRQANAYLDATDARFNY